MQSKINVYVLVSLGLYLWEHIFEADMVQKMGGVWSYGARQIKDVQFRYYFNMGQYQ
jgi:hypothetical protein